MRSICGEQVIVAEGKEFTADTLAKLLTEQYDVQYNVAFNDCLELIVKWEEAGIIEQ